MFAAGRQRLFPWDGSLRSALFPRKESLAACLQQWNCEVRYSHDLRIGGSAWFPSLITQTKFHRPCKVGNPEVHRCQTFVTSSGLVCGIPFAGNKADRREPSLQRVCPQTRPNPWQRVSVGGRRLLQACTNSRGRPPTVDMRSPRFP